MMNVEIINVGTELLLGEVINTNATYIQKMCRDLGFNVYYQTVVGDNPKRLKECLEIAFLRGANCVITTGGLGPTNDDLTKELSAQYLGLDCIYNEEEAKKVYDKCSFVTNKKEIAQNNYKQAYFPKDCIILENDVGTANGCIMKKDNQMIINLPGPPKEMKYVIEKSLKPYLKQYQKEKIFTYDISTMFIGESLLHEKLEDIINNQKQISIALYAGEDIVRIRLAIKAKNQEEADDKVEQTKKEIEERISSYIIKEKNIKEALMNIMVPYKIKYDGSFRLDHFFLDGLFKEEDAKLEMEIITKQEKLGERLIIIINQEETLEIPLLKKAEYSYTKAESRIMFFIYKYLKNQK